MGIRKFYKLCSLTASLIVLGNITQNKTIAQVEANYSTTIFKNWITFGGQQGVFAQFPNSSFWKPEPDLTLEFWMRSNQPVPTIFQHIFGNCWNPMGANFDSDWGFGFALINNRIGFHVIINGVNQFETSNPTDTLSACKWYHIAGVKEGQQTRIYVNGVLRATKVLPPGSLRISNGPANLGTNYPSGYNNFYNGNIDEFRLWNFARTDVQIQANMNDTLLGNEPGLQAYYKLNEVGQGNGITLVNSAVASGSQMNGITVSSNSNYPKLTQTEVLPFPPSPLVPTQPTFCFPGSNFNLSVNPVTGANVIRYNWYSLTGSDTVQITGTSGTMYQTPVLGRTDTFFVSSVNNLRCESPKVPVIAKVFPKPPIPQISSYPNPSCFGQPTVLKAIADNPNEFFWYNGINGSNFISGVIGDSLTLPTPTNGDTIWVAIKGGQGGCKSEKAFTTLNVIPQLPSPNVIADPNPFCAPSNILLSSDIPVNSRYFWFRGGQGNIFLDSTEVPEFIRMNQEKQDTIWLSYITKSGNCVSPEGFVILTPTQKPKFSIEAELVCPGRQSAFTIKGLQGWKVEVFEDSILSKSVLETQTNLATLSPIINGEKNYWFRIVSPGSLCEPQILSHLFKVKVVSIGNSDTSCLQPPALEIPNLITPNGDSINDYFEIKNLEFYQPAAIQIFNRWGKPVFESGNYQNNWQGNEGTYFFLIQFPTQKMSGYVSVIGN